MILCEMLDELIRYEEWAAMLSTPTNHIRAMRRVWRMGGQRIRLFCLNLSRFFKKVWMSTFLLHAQRVASVKGEYRGVVLCICCVWVAWRSTKIGISPPSPPATCLLALSSRPPSPTFKTPRKNIPGHHRNTHVTPSSRSVRSLLFNKIKTKNNWKIITPATRASDPSDTFLRADGWEITPVQHLGWAKRACILTIRAEIQLVSRIGSGREVWLRSRAFIRARLRSRQELEQRAADAGALLFLFFSNKVFHRVSPTEAYITATFRDVENALTG